MLQINGKTFMNLQEAVQWLLDNNCIPFQCTADYQANTEIGLGTIVNPSPAKVRIGSLIFFADSKVSTVIGITENGFICSDKYNNLVDDVVYVSNVALNASGHLIVTLSNGDNIDAGLIKQVSSFSINASQHLIVSYNDGSSTDLGAIFSGNVTIGGNLTVTGGISGNAITGDSIIENMSGYSYEDDPITGVTKDYIYCGVVKNGNKLTFVWAVNLTKTQAGLSGGTMPIGQFNYPISVDSKLVATQIGAYYYLAVGKAQLFKNAWTYQELPYNIQKIAGNKIKLALDNGYFNDTNFPVNDKFYVRVEATFLLSDPLNS